MSTKTANSARARTRKSRVATSIALACALMAESANAQFAVVDAPHTIQNVLTQLGTQAKHVAEYGKQAQRWIQQYQHMQQQLIQLQGFVSAAMPMTDQFESRPDDYGMKDECPGSTGSLSLAGLRQQFVPDMDAEVIEQQLKICQRTVLAENAKYNETVRVLKDLRARATEFQQLEVRRISVGSSQGDLAANENDVNRFSTRVQMDLEYWQAMMTGYDSYIVALNKDQQRLARKALNGQKNDGPVGNLLGTIVQGATLKVALKAASGRDR